MKTEEALIKLIHEKFKDLTEEQIQMIFESIQRTKKKKPKKSS